MIDAKIYYIPHPQWDEAATLLSDFRQRLCDVPHHCHKIEQLARQIFWSALYLHAVQILTTTLLTLTSTPGTDTGLLHLDASSTLTKSNEYSVQQWDRAMITKSNFERATTLPQLLRNWNLDGSFRSLYSLNLQNFRLLGADDLELQVPRPGSLQQEVNLLDTRPENLRRTLRSTSMSTVSPEHVLTIFFPLPVPCDSENSADATGWIIWSILGPCSSIFL